MNCTGLKELLEVFVEKNCVASEYPSELDELLSDTAKTGIVRFSWQLLKPLLKFRLECVLKSEALAKNFNDVGNEDEELACQLQQRLDMFDNPPFTIQRVCELVVHPRQHYKRRDRYMRAMEKNLMVVSTQAPDLTWMKSPRLTQLLEQPTAVNDEASHNHTPNHTPTSIENHELTEQSIVTPASSNDILSAVENIETDQSVTHAPSVGLGLPRKRSASQRDGLDAGGRGRGIEEEEVMGLVLQEADSTTIEHAFQPPDITEPQEQKRDSHMKEHAEPPPPEKQQEDPELGGLNSTEGSREDSRPVDAETREDSTKDVEESAAKKVKYVFEPPREDGDMLTVSSGREVGGAEVEAAQKKETYKEAATGQMESETPSDSTQVTQEMMETS